MHEDARWWSARNLCGRFLSADLPPLGTLSDIYRWKKPLNQPSVIHLNGIFHCNAHPFSWYLAATKKLSPCVPWKPWMYCNSSTSWWWEPWRCSPSFCEQQGTWDMNQLSFCCDFRQIDDNRCRAFLDVATWHASLWKNKQKLWEWIIFIQKVMICG